MKVYRLEIAKFDDRDKRQQLYRLAEQCQQIVNHIWQQWECWHVQNGSREKLIAHLNADKAWREQKQGERPKWPVDCLPTIPGKKNTRGNNFNLQNKIYADITKHFADVHARIRVLLLNITLKKIKTTKSDSGNLKGWVAILLNRQGRPSSTRPMPIPFDVANSKVVPSQDAKGDASLFIRLHRDETKARSITSYEEFKLRTTGPAARYIKPVCCMATGEWSYKGSSLFYDSHKKKWFALLVCEIPPAEKVAASEGSYGILRCGYEHPVQLRITGRRRFIRNFGQGRAVEATRRQLLTQRWSRQENYRVAGSSNKSHGLKRAMGPVFLLSRRWKDFVKRYNHTLTTELVKLCVAEGIGELKFFQPTKARFLSEAGKIPGRHDATGWDFYQIGSLLCYKCERHGIKFSVVKSGEKRGKKKDCA